MTLAMILGLVIYAILLGVVIWILEDAYRLVRPLVHHPLQGRDRHHDRTR